MRLVDLLFLAVAAAALEAQPLELAWKGQASAGWRSAEPLVPQSRLTLGVDYEPPSWSFALEGGLAVSPNGSKFVLDQAWVAWIPVPGFAAGAGWRPETQGPALFHDLVPTFSVPDKLSVLTTGGRAVPPSPGEVSLRLGWGEWSAELEAAPLPGPTTLPDPQSVWFPGRAIPTTFDAGASVYLVEFKGFENTDERKLWASRWPLRIKGRWSGAWGDLTGGWYRGPDSEVSFLPSLVNPGATWDLTLTAQRLEVQALWATVEVPVGPVLTFAEVKKVVGRGFLSSGFDASWELRDEALRQRPTLTQTLEAVEGASWSKSLGGDSMVRLWGEVAQYRDLDDSTRAAPDFTTGVTAGLRWEDSADGLSFDLLGGTPWNGGQGWAFARLAWNWSEGRELWVGLPVFWGTKDSEWGQFRDQVQGLTGVSWNE